MTFSVHIRKSIKEAWGLFMKGPEIFIVTALGYIVVQAILSKIPVLGGLVSYLLQIFIVPVFYLFADQAAREGKVTFSEIKKLQNFVAHLLVLVIAAFVLVLLGFCLLILPGIYLMIAYWFASQFVLFEGKNFWDAMEASRKLVNKNWFGVFGFAIVVFFLAISGVLLLGVGLLVTMPLASITMYTMFRDIQRQVTHSSIQEVMV